MPVLTGSALQNAGMGLLLTRSRTTAGAEDGAMLVQADGKTEAVPVSADGPWQRWYSRPPRTLTWVN